jgi:transposase
VSWKPVAQVVSDTVAGHLANRRDVRQRPGKTTDKGDATWIAARLAPGVITPRCAPPPTRRAFREPTRTRGALVQTRTHATNRVDNILEATTIPLARVVSDVCGGRARRMLDAWGGGARAPPPLSVMALGSVRGQIPPREVAVDGQGPAHHATLIQGALALVAGLGAQMAAIEQQLHELRREMAPQREPLGSLPGGRAMTAPALMAESGVDMTRWGSASRPASGAGCSPGTDERAGTRRTGRTRTGNRLGVGCWCRGRGRQASPRRCWGGVSSPGSTPGEQESRGGGGTHNRGAQVPSSPGGDLVAEERYDRLGPRQEERARTRARTARELLGSAVPVNQGAEAAGSHRGTVLRGCL